MRLIILLIASFCGYSLADIPDKEFARCSSMNGDLDKLECFDNLAKKYHLDGSQKSIEEIEDSGEWNVSISVNPIDDSKTVHLSLLEASGRSSPLDKPISLNIRCKSIKTDVYINWGTYVGSDAKVTLRVGEEKAVTRNWILSTDGTATFYPRRVVHLIKKLLTKDGLVAQITPYMEDPSTGIFEIRGLSEVIQPLRDACLW